MTTLFFSEELVSSLEAFSAQQEKAVTPELLKIVDNISKTGTLKGYIAKIDKEALKAEDEENDVEKRSQRFLYALDSFDEAPFTVQRLCELILSPEKVYSTYFKYISALEKMVNITSTLPTLTPQQIQTINVTGVVAPHDDDPTTSTSTSSNTLTPDDYPTSMNVDLNGVQATFPNQANASSSSMSNDDVKNNNVNLSSQEEKPPTPMDM